MKAMLSHVYAYQRIDRLCIWNQCLLKHRTFPWQPPEYVPVVYNGVFGDQRCKIVDGFPNPPGGQPFSCPEQGSGGGGSGGGGGARDPDNDSTGKQPLMTTLFRTRLMAWKRPCMAWSQYLMLWIIVEN